MFIQIIILSILICRFSLFAQEIQERKSSVPNNNGGAIILNGFDYSQYKFAEEVNQLAKQFPNDDNNNKEYDIWNDKNDTNSKTVIFDQISQATLKKICNDLDLIVYISSEKATIDCTKELKITNDEDIFEYIMPDDIDVIVKRQIDHTDLLEEGSGSAAPEESETNNSNDNSKDIISSEPDAIITDKDAVDQYEEKEEFDDIKSNTTTSDISQINTTIDTIEEESKIVEEEPSQFEESIPEETETVQLEEEPSPFEESIPKDTETVQPQVNAISTVAPTISETQFVVSNTNETNEPKTINKETPEENWNELEKESNIVRHQQPKTLLKETNNNITAATGESSKETTTDLASKDTSILLFLFLAVVVVGVSAFGYNYIKKRKQQSQDLERIERVSASVLKRSFQSLTRLETTGQEMKPLITNGENQQQNEQRTTKSDAERKENGTIPETDEPNGERVITGIKAAS